MTVTFQKRQKEMKRLEKQRAKAEKRAQKKEARRAAKEMTQAIGGAPEANQPFLDEPLLKPPEAKDDLNK